MTTGANWPFRPKDLELIRELLPECNPRALTLDWLPWVGGRVQTNMYQKRAKATEEGNQSFYVLECRGYDQQYLRIKTASTVPAGETFNLRQHDDVCSNFWQFEIIGTRGMLVS